MPDLFFPDVSEFQPTVDGAALVAAGYPVIIARVHNGYRADHTMTARRDYLRTCGFSAIGWYQYLAASNDPSQQARDFLATLGSMAANEFAVCDLEEGTGDQTGRANAWFAVVDPAVPAGGQAWLYSGASFLSTNLGGTTRWGKRPLWIASYGSGEPAGAAVWQYTNGQYTSGGYKPISFPAIGVCDANVFHGTAAEFCSRFNLRGGAAAPTQRTGAVDLRRTTKGYYIFASDGGVFCFGDAQFYGSVPGMKPPPTLNAPIVGGAVTTTEKGYWLAGSDGGVFSFGDAKFDGSMGGKKMNSPVVGIEADPDGEGYWLLGADGGVFSFAAPFYGSASGLVQT